MYVSNYVTCQHITDGTTTFNFTNTDKNYDINKDWTATLLTFFTHYSANAV